MSLSGSEQQDTPQETALDISLSYIYKVSQTPVFLLTIQTFQHFNSMSTAEHLQWAQHHDRHHAGCQD